MLNKHEQKIKETIELINIANSKNQWCRIEYLTKYLYKLMKERKTYIRFRN